MIAKTFFKKKNYKLKDLFPEINFKANKSFDKIRPLLKAGPKDLSFFDSSKYKDDAKKTKALYCITTQELKKFLPEKTEKIVVKNVLLELAKILKKIYPDADIDHPDLTLRPLAKNINL